MNIKHSFTFIIAYRHQPDRLKLLRRTIDWVNSFSGSQVILVEQDKHSKISNLDLKCKHIFVKSVMPFNKAWAFNIGLEYAKSEIIVFGDSDIVMRPDDFIKALGEVKNYDMVNPYNSVVDLTLEESNLPLEHIMNISRSGRGTDDNQKINIGGGICIFRRESIIKIGGWCEDFLGWGGEDDYQELKIKKFLNWTELDSNCFHLYHIKQVVDQIHYSNNIGFLKKAASLSDDNFMRMINNSKPKIGKLNKYADNR